ncbi:hypothetical protein CPC08DRAFT_706521 [Agrocybe pediades]|nr:hypothetical protein CPC08DRAFT_706521 [Agrocybe pediades]
MSSSVILTVYLLHRRCFPTVFPRRNTTSFRPGRNKQLGKAIREALKDSEWSKTNIFAKNLNDDKKLLDKEAKEGVEIQKNMGGKSLKWNLTVRISTIFDRRLFRLHHP